MPAKLLYRDAQGRDASVDIPESGAFLGRAVNCVVRTDDATVSRYNTKISLQGGRWVVEDQKSANGSYVNDQRVQQAPLAHGNIIRCGSLQVRFVEEAASPASRSNNPATTPQVEAVPQVDPNPRATEAVPIKAAGQGAGVPPQQVQPVQVVASEPAAGTQAHGPLAAELVRVQMERDKALADIADVAKKGEEMAGRLEMAEENVTRLRTDLNGAKEALDKTRRQLEQSEKVLRSESGVSEELRKENSFLKAELEKVRALAGELKSTAEKQERELAAAREDVKRSKQATDNLQQKLSEANRARDEQIRNVNDQRGDVDKLKDILKERERMLEERRVGLVNLESQVKEYRARTESQEKDLATLRTEKEATDKKNARSQTLIEELRAEIERLNKSLEGQQEGGEQLGIVSRENGELRQQNQEVKQALRESQADVEKLKVYGDQLKVELERVKGSVAQINEDKKASLAKAQGSLDQAVKAAVAEVQGKLEERAQAERQKFTVERQQLIDARDKLLAERDAALKDRDAAQAATQEHGDTAQRLAAAQKDLSTLRDERDQLAQKLNALSAAQAQSGNATDAAAQKLQMAQREADVLRDQMDALRGQLKKALDDAEAARAQAAAAPAAAAGGNSDAVRLLSEMKQLASTAYDGINDALSELRLSLVLAQETYERMERQIPDRDAARRVRDAIEQTMDRADEAKGHIRSLRSVLD